eukprot:2895198-Rhodomonas_salina.1
MVPFSSALLLPHPVHYLSHLPPEAESGMLPTAKATTKPTGGAGRGGAGGRSTATTLSAPKPPTGGGGQREGGKITTHSQRVGTAEGKTSMRMKEGEKRDLEGEKKTIVRRTTNVGPLSIRSATLYVCAPAITCPVLISCERQHC